MKARHFILGLKFMLIFFAGIGIEATYREIVCRQLSVTVYSPQDYTMTIVPKDPDWPVMVSERVELPPQPKAPRVKKIKQVSKEQGVNSKVYARR